MCSEEKQVCNVPFDPDDDIEPKIIAEGMKIHLEEKRLKGFPIVRTDPETGCTYSELPDGTKVYEPIGREELRELCDRHGFNLSREEKDKRLRQLDKKKKELLARYKK